MNIPLFLKKSLTFVVLFGFVIMGIVSFTKLPLFNNASVLGLTSGVRYKEKVFTEVKVTKNVTYGSAIPLWCNDCDKSQNGHIRA